MTRFLYGGNPLLKLSGAHRIRTAHTGRRRDRRLRMEMLEDRRLLTITVDTLVDEFDGSIVDGDISLRDAIAAAPSGETIHFAVTGTITLTLGDLLINRNLTINGPGASVLTIDTSGNDPTPSVNNGDGRRVFNIDDGNLLPDKTVVISGLTLTGGDMFGDGGGIRNAEKLTVVGSRITGNVAHGTVVYCPYYCYFYNDHVGGGIWSSGSLTVIGSTVSGNNSTGSGGGIYGTGNIVIDHSDVNGNSSGRDGGGIYRGGAGTLTVTNSTITRNSAGANGGGIHGSNLTVTGSTINDNTANLTGGGVSGGNLTITSSTISGNSTQFGRGGGIIGNGDLTVTASTIADNSAGGSGGGIWGNGNVAVTNSTISGNFAVGTLVTCGYYTCYYYHHAGGGIWSYASLIVTGSTLSGNVATGDGGGIRANGNLSVTATTIDGNTAGGSGGGILGGNVTVVTSTITGNAATGSGGGVSSNGNLTVTASTIGGNTAGGSGGGVHAVGTSVVLDANTVVANSTGGEGGGVFSTSTILTIVNATVSMNVAVGHGGGIFVNPLHAGQAIVSIAYSTVAYNRADTFNTSVRFGGGLFVRAGTLILDHVIAAENYTTLDTRSDVAGLLGVIMDAHWSIIGHNADSGLAEASVGSPDGNGNLIGGPVGGAIDPLLGPLVANGGVTRTHALLAGSPAVDAGRPAAVPGVGGVPLRDQRGNPFTRVFDGDGSGGARIDIGAYERQSLVGLNMRVDTLLDESDGDYSLGDFSLREAIELAGGSVLTIDSISFAASLTSGGPATIVLTLGELAITDTLLITGPGANLLTIDASGNDPTPAMKNGDGSRVFNVDDGDAVTQVNVAMIGLTLTGGDVSGSGGAIRNVENLTVTNSTISGNAAILGSGGGIYSRSPYYGNLTVTGSTISGNSAISGGGIQGENVTVSFSTLSGNTASTRGGGIANSFGNLRVTNSTISGNSAVEGGGIYKCGFYNCGNLTVTNSMIRGNTASSSGGGISAGNLAVINSTISGNSAGQGGGIDGFGGYDHFMTVTSSTISGNSASGSGGGISNYGNLTVTSSTISGNSARYGGGIYNDDGNLTVTSSTISGNSASSNGGGIGNFFGGLTVTHSTISGNASVSGGGIYLFGDLKVTNSTISGNSASSEGGGLFNYFGLAVIEFSTIAGNHAPAGRGSGVASFGDSYAQTRVRSSIIAGNVNSDVNFVFGGSNSFLSSGYNLIGTGNALGRFNQAGDQTGVTNPRLGPLTLNGGPTKTHALLPGSPAIDRGDPAAVAGGGIVPLRDQRGAPLTRVFDGDAVPGARIDIGAFEVQPLLVQGDFNNDGRYDLQDIDALVVAIAAGSNGLAFDLTGDGLVNLADRDAWLAEAGAVNLPFGNPYLPGDANLDGAVDGSDFGIWNANKYTSLAAWSAGDFNADGLIDGSDYGVWNGNKFTSSDVGERLSIALLPKAANAVTPRRPPIARSSRLATGTGRSAVSMFIPRFAVKATDSYFAELSATR